MFPESADSLRVFANCCTKGVRLQWDRREGWQLGRRVHPITCMNVKTKELQKWAPCECMKRKRRIAAVKKGDLFQNGNFEYILGSFRKSGKQRTCRIPRTWKRVRKMGDGEMGEDEEVDVVRRRRGKDG